MHSNVKFEYLYRDAGNYKFWNFVIFADPSPMKLEEVEDRIRNSLDSRESFIAHQIRIPEVFPFPNSEPTEDDHCFHEFASIKPTMDIPNDVHSRSVAEFVKEIEDVARHGWHVFDPQYTVR